MNCLKTKQPSDTESVLDLSLAEGPELSPLVNQGNIVAVRNIDNDSYPYYVLLASSSDVNTILLRYMNRVQMTIL